MFTEVLGTVNGEEYKLHDGSTFAAGNVAIVLTWSGSADLDLGVLDTQGNLVGSSERNTGNREEVRFTAASGFQFKIGVVNYSTETVQYKLTLESPRSVTFGSTASAPIRSGK
jgi:hypothetical protein